MNKKLKIAIPIVCVLVVVITYWMIFDIKKKVNNMNEQDLNNTEMQNTVDENTIEEDNTVEEENIVNTAESTANNENTNSSSEEIAEKDDVYATNKFDEAKYLVKKAWGDDDTVYFTNEGVTSEGLYIVAAREKSTTNVRNYFKVNIETKDVDVDY